MMSILSFMPKHTCYASRLIELGAIMDRIPEDFFGKNSKYVHSMLL